jgi:hypothetical protein
MATYKQNERTTMLEVLKTIGPDGNMLTTAEVLEETNEVIQDLVWTEANNKMTHIGTVRNSDPEGEIRDFNAGTSRAASTRERIEDVIVQIERYSEPDKKLLDMMGSPDAYRADEARSITEGMGKQMVNKIFYGNNATNQADMTGIQPRLGTVDSVRVWNTGGTGSDVSSIYGVIWGLDTCHMVYPTGTQVGIGVTDHGEQTVLDPADSTKQFQAYRTHFTMDFGLHVRRPDSLIRIANIETAGSSSTFNEDLLIKALNKAYMRGIRMVLYVNDTIYSQMQIRMKDKANVNFSWSNAFGENTLTFMGRPVRMVDKITNTETAIS